MDNKIDRDVNAAWRRIEAWLTREHPAKTQMLAPGASTAQLDRLAEAFGFPLPDDLRALLAVHNGAEPRFEFTRFVHSCAYQVGGCLFQLLSIDDMLQEWRMRNTALKLSDQKNSELAGLAEGVKPVFWSRSGWLPFARGDQGDCFCVDLDPAPDGVFGQVFAWYSADGPACVIAPSIGTWLSILADCMESGHMSFDEGQVRHDEE